MVPRPEGPEITDLVAALEAHFVGRKDRYMLQQDDGSYVSIERKLTRAILTAHCRGQVTVASYTNNENGLTHVAVLDIDSKDPAAKELVVFSLNWLKHFNIPAFLEPSGGKGYHTWVLFKCWVPAVKARALLQALVNDWNTDHEGEIPPEKIEIFPKQITPATFDHPGFGVKLPWGIHRTGQKWTPLMGSDTKPLADWGLSIVNDAPRVTEFDLDAVLENYPEALSTSLVPQKTGGVPRQDMPEDLNILAIQKLQGQCSFVQHCIKDAADLPRNHWWGLISLLAAFGETGKGKAHEWSQAYPTYNFTETEKYWADAEKARVVKGVGPLTCSYIKNTLGFTCPELCEAKKLECDSPAGMAVKRAQVDTILTRTKGVTVKYHEKSKKYSVEVNCPVIAEEIAEEWVFKTVRDNEEIFYYDNGLYKNPAKPIIKALVQQKLLHYTTSHRVDEVVNYVKLITYIDRTEFNSDLYILNLNNGLLDTRSMTLSDHDPGFLSTIRIPITYNPTAKYPKIEKFFGEVFEPSDIPLIEEIFAYCLEPEHTIHKAFLFLGDGSNGKSKTIDLLSAFLGPQNCSTLELQQFDTNRFSSAMLWGKLANLCADLPTTTINHTGTFKMLTGGDTVRAEKKFLDGFSFKNTAKLVFSANKPPYIKGEDSSAWWRRWILINFPNSFPDNDPNTDKNILDKLTTEEELSGLFNTALKALQRLRGNQMFCKMPNPEEVSENYWRAANPVYGFIQEHCTISDDSWIKKDELYEYYKAYCKQQKIPVTQKESFGRALKNSPLASTVKNDRQRFMGQLAYGWKGIQISEESPLLNNGDVMENNNVKINGKSSENDGENNELDF